MRALVDLVDSVTGTFRFIVGLIVLCGFGFGLIMTAGASYVAPKITEEATEKATAFGERALAEARQQRREAELAQDGWGYGSSEPVRGASNSGIRAQRGGYDDGQSEGWGSSSR